MEKPAESLPLLLACTDSKCFSTLYQPLGCHSTSFLPLNKPNFFLNWLVFCHMLILAFHLGGNYNWTAAGLVKWWTLVAMQDGRLKSSQGPLYSLGPKMQLLCCAHFTCSPAHLSAQLSTHVYSDVSCICSSWAVMCVCFAFHIDEIAILRGTLNDNTIATIIKAMF